LDGMRASIVIAGHNEGDLLWRTVQSTLEASADLDREIIVADDASTDGSVEEVRRRFPQVRIVASRKRGGPSPTKDRGARAARGRVLFFLDGHCKPSKGSLRRMVEDVDDLDGRAIVTPRIPHVDTETWTFHPGIVGYGFNMDLVTFDCGWIERKYMRREGRFYESPALIGCCAAMSRRLYERLRGFDSKMIEWGLEDIDLGFKAWLLGHSILVDARIAIGHRFQSNFNRYTVSEVSVLYNKLRMARKNFTEGTWREWVDTTRQGEKETTWNDAWALFSKRRRGVEEERRYLMARRVRDEFEYAERYGLEWPVERRGKSSVRCGGLVDC